MSERNARKDLLHSSDLTAFESNLDPVWMGGRLGQDVFHDPLGEFPGALIFFQYDQNTKAGPNVTPSCHNSFLFTPWLL